MKRILKHLAAAAAVGMILGLGYGGVAHAGYVGWVMYPGNPQANYTAHGTVSNYVTIQTTLFSNSVYAYVTGYSGGYINAVTLNCSNGQQNSDLVGSVALYCPPGGSVNNGNGTLTSY